MDTQDHERILIAKTFGLSNAEDIIKAYNVEKTRHERLDLSACCTMLQVETGGANIYGHDPVRRGQSFGGHVTHANYFAYKVRRKLGMGNQGVGPCQLTSPGLQDAADRRGGCWKPLHNMTVGFDFLAELLGRHGTWRLAFQHYNGSGPAAVHYGDTAAALIKLWHNRFND